MSRSVNLDFFAAREDQCALLDFLFSATDVRVFESYSEFGSELREFKNLAEVSTAFPLGADNHGTGYAVSLQLWSPSAMTHPSIERISLDPKACNGHTFRQRIQGGGLMQLYLGGLHGKVLTMSHFGHQSQKRAETWDVAEGVNWEALATTSSKIQYHLRKRLAVGKVPGRPVLRQALDLVKSGHLLKLSVKSPIQFDLLAQ